MVKKGWRKPVDLTTTEYKQFKKNGMSEQQIALMCGISRVTLTRWKKENDVMGYNLNAREVVKPFTERGGKRLKMMIQRTKELRKAYWSNRAIAKELGISNASLLKIIEMYLPEEKRKTPIKYTEEQKERAKKAGISMHNVTNRLRMGKDIDEALDTPLAQRAFFTKEQNKLIKKSGIHRATVMSRMKKGMTFQDAITQPLQKINKPGRKHKK